MKSAQPTFMYYKRSRVAERVLRHTRCQREVGPARGQSDYSTCTLLLYIAHFYNTVESRSSAEPLTSERSGLGVRERRDDENGEGPIRQRARAHRAPPLHFTSLRSRMSRRAALHLMDVSERTLLSFAECTAARRCLCHYSCRVAVFVNMSSYYTHMITARMCSCV